jgi:cyclopropane fatty-acyl-phospholipid synthase-like methyltransferase
LKEELLQTVLAGTIERGLDRLQRALDAEEDPQSRLWLTAYKYILTICEALIRHIRHRTAPYRSSSD